jgi:hypothetical protein
MIMMAAARGPARHDHDAAEASAVTAAQFLLEVRAAHPLSTTAGAADFSPTLSPAPAFRRPRRRRHVAQIALKTSKKTFE